MSSRYNSTFMLSDVELGVMISVNVLFSVAGAVGNLLICAAFLMHRHLRSTMNIFIFSLACSDLLVCLLAQPMFVASLVKSHPQEQASTVSESIRKRLTWVSLLASIGNLLGVTLDRYFIISNPLRYTMRVTTRSACVFVAVVWAIAAVLGLITESCGVAKVVGQLYVAVLLLGVIIPLYCKILCIARRHARIIHSSLSQIQFQAHRQTLSQRTCSFNVQKADRNSLKTVGIICSIFLIGWFPILILPFIYRAESDDRSVLLDAFQWANTFALCSSACNPVVYSWRDRRFRNALTVTYTRWRTRRSFSVNDYTGCTEKVEMKKG